MCPVLATACCLRWLAPGSLRRGRSGRGCEAWDGGEHWALIFAVLGVLLLVRSRHESWLKKVLLVAWKRPGGTWLGKCRQDPPGQVQCAVCWWGALEECGSLASTRCPEELAPWSA